MVILAVSTALASAACFAAGSALQHRVASASSAEDESTPRLMGRLVRRKSWLAGLLLSAVAFCLHALALKIGDLMLVQPVIVSGIVFAVLFRAAFERRLPSRKVMAWLALTWTGLALFIAVRPTTATGPPTDVHAAWIVAAGAGVVVLAMFLAARTSVDRRRGLLLGGAAGILFGLVAGLTKLVMAQLDQGLLHVLGHWSLWGVVGVGAWAILLNQRAYQATRLSVSTPVLNILQVLMAIAFGIVVFNEKLAASPIVLIAEVVGLALMVFGVHQLATRSTAPPRSRPPGSDPVTAPVERSVD